LTVPPTNPFAAAISIASLPATRRVELLSSAQQRQASAISSAISPLDQLRASLKRELRPDVSVASARRLATELGDGFAAATRALDRLYPPPPVQPAHVALTDATRRAHEGYVALAAAIGERNVTRYETAHKAVEAAEAAVDSALGSFALLGYGATPQAPSEAAPGG